MKYRLGVLAVAAAAIAAIVPAIQCGLPWMRAQDVSVVNGDVTLAGTLWTPRWFRPPYPAAAIVHGSGPATRADVRGWVRRFVPDGLAVLALDKRGVGGSGGQYEDVAIDNGARQFELLAGDVLAAVEYLDGRPNIDPDRIGLLGGSQAGWIMPLAATRTSKLAFLVIVSGPAVTLGQEIFYSQLTGDNPGLHRPDGGFSDEEIARRMDAFLGPHGYDPTAALERLEVPTLWLVGARDRSVPTALGARVLRRLATAGRPIDLEIYPDGDHALRRVSGERIPYWRDVRAWLRAHAVLAP